MPADQQSAVFRTLLTLLCAVFGGVLFNWLGTPLPWMLGPLAVTILGAITHGKTTIPKWAREFAIPVLGVGIGSAFSPSLVQGIQSWALLLVIMLLFSVFAIAIGSFYFQRVLGCNRVTSFCCALPGGLSEVLVVAPQLGADVRTVVLAQVIRVVMLVFCIPFGFKFFTADYTAVVAANSGTGAIEASELVILLGCAIAGYYAGRWLKLPMGVLIGPLVLSAAVHLTGYSSSAPPDWSISAVQVVIGVSAGCRFAGLKLLVAARVLAAAIVWTVMLVLLALGFAVLGQLLTGRDLQALILAFTPGGLQEMTLISLVLGMDVAFVSAMHICRILFVTSVLLPAWQYIATRQAAESGD